MQGYDDGGLGNRRGPLSRERERRERERSQEGKLLDLEYLASDECVREHLKAIEDRTERIIKPEYEKICRYFAEGNMEEVNLAADQLLANIKVDSKIALAYSCFFDELKLQPEKVIGSYNGKQVTTHTLYYNIFEIAANFSEKNKQLLAAVGCTAFEAKINCQQFSEDHKEELRNIHFAIDFKHFVIREMQHEMGYDRLYSPR